MSIEEELYARSGSKCELCSNTENLCVYTVPPSEEESIDMCALICNICAKQIEACDKPNPNHWRCLSDSMWSEALSVKIVCWRMLSRLSEESWAQDLLDMMYLDDEALSLAKSVLSGQVDNALVHVDSNGVTLLAGDTVTLIKDLNVKGAGFTAKRGTAVRKISLVPDNHEHIEGRVEGQKIVILTKFVKKNI